MKLSNFIFVLFLSSLLLLMPLIRPGSTYLVRPLENTQIIKNVQSPRVIIIADIVEPINLNISSHNPETETMVILISTSFNERLEVSLDNRGYYLFEFFSGSITNIEIQEAGIFSSSLIIIGFFGLVVIIHLVRRQLSPEIVY